MAVQIIDVKIDVKIKKKKKRKIIKKERVFYKQFVKHEYKTFLDRKKLC